MVIQEIGKIVTGNHHGFDEAQREYISFRDIWRFLKRHASRLAICTAIGVVAGGLYIFSTEPMFSATTRLVMDPEQGRIASQDAFSGTIIIEAAEIASQVEIVKSESIARDVIAKLKLDHDPEIIGGTSWRGMITEGIREIIHGFHKPEAAAQSATETPEEGLMRRTMASFLSRVTVTRVGQSYILEIGYSSTDPEKAARVANAIADAYIRSGLAERAAAAQSGAKWLESRLIEVGRKARETAMQAEEFRAKNGIMEINATSSLDQQQLSEISTQELSARTQTAAEAAKYDAISRLKSGEAPDTTVQEAVNNPRIQKLQEDLSVAVSKLNALTSRYDAGNPAVVAAQDEVAGLKKAIDDEYSRIQSLYATNLEVAKGREQLLKNQLETLTAAGTDKNLARVELTEMESQATTYRRIYETILQQVTGAIQRQSFPIGNARIVTAATAPLSKNWPKPSLIIPLTGMLGLAGGLGMALASDGYRRRLNVVGRLRNELGINSLGTIPLISREGDLAAGVSPVAIDVAYRRVLDAPYSRFTEALRGIRGSIDAAFRSNNSTVIGITSIAPNTGKTTLAVNLAQVYKHEGSNVVLVDADFISARLSGIAAETGQTFGLKVLGPDYAAQRKGNRPNAEAEPAADGEGALSTVIVPDILRSAGPHQRFGHLMALRQEIEALRRKFKIVIVDMSPFEGSADTRQICSFMDGVLLVLGNGSPMTAERIQNALAEFSTSRINLLGIVTTQLGPEKAKPVTGRHRLLKPAPPSAPSRTVSSVPAIISRATTSPLKMTIGIASSGRRDILSAILPQISKQTRQPDEVIVCVTSTADIDQVSLASLACPVRIIISERGLCRQRNEIVANADDADVILFLDDDFIMVPNYVERLESIFQTNPDVAMCTGKVLADGIIGPGISVHDGLKLISARARQASSLPMTISPIYNAYGCNMAMRMSAVSAGQIRFDENLPAYGWLEDVDFSRRIAEYGGVVSADCLEGVHLGVKVARTAGLKLGYSQIANPIYLMRKQTMGTRYGAVQIGRNLAANIAKCLRPEPWVDRRGRLKGNMIALADLMRGRLTPRRIESMD